jgi:hypothetical protein
MADAADILRAFAIFSALFSIDARAPCRDMRHARVQRNARRGGAGVFADVIADVFAVFTPFFAADLRHIAIH